MEVEITIAGQDVVLSDQTDIIRMFTDQPELDHVEIEHEADSRLIFSCRELIDTLLRLGFPMEVYILPLDRHEYIISSYAHIMADHLDDELDHLEGNDA